MNSLVRAWRSLMGPSGWRSLLGPVAFAVVGIGLLVYDHVNRKVTDVVFWLTLALIVAVFLRMVETNRRQSRALARQRRDALVDPVTGLRTRDGLESDLAAAARAPGEGWLLIMVDLSGLDALNDRRGYAAGDELLSGFARQLVDAVTPLDGIAYRVAAGRLAALVPVGERESAEIVLAATGALRGDGSGPPLGLSFGEVAIPGEASDAEAAFQLVASRLAAQRQGQHSSARRQAHAVLMAALAARQPELREELRVAAYQAISLGRRLGLSAEEIDDVALAAELQGVGRLGIPEAILDSEASFDAGEVEPIRDSPLAAERIVGASSALAPVAALVRASAERFDGRGAPDGLAGEEIPLGSRVIAVSVAFAAMTSPRPYRPARAPAEALAELRRCAGSQFDPHVVEAMGEEVAVEAQPAAASS